VYYNNSAKGKWREIWKYNIKIDVDFSIKFDCEKLAQEKMEVHRQYVMVIWMIKGEISIIKAFSL